MKKQSEIINDTKNAKMIRLWTNEIRIIYKHFFGDDQYIKDFNSLSDAMEMFKTVDTEDLSYKELMDLGFKI
jgi:hypothetical protein